MKLYIMRHGQTDWNKTRRLQGRSDVPLNEFGRHLARESSKKMQSIEFSAAYTSPLKRARETGELVLADQDVKLLDDEGLIEMSFGEFEGLSCGADTWEIPDERFKAFFGQPEQYVAPVDAETFEELIARVRDFLDRLLEKHQEGNILIICHGVVMGAFLSIIKKRELKDFWRDTVAKNCAVNIVEVKAGRLEMVEEGVVYYDDTVKPW